MRTCVRVCVCMRVGVVSNTLSWDCKHCIMSLFMCFKEIFLGHCTRIVKGELQYTHTHRILSNILCDLSDVSTI